MRKIPTRYNPKQVESKWFDFWKSKGYFHSEVRMDKKPYSIVIPPPNVTGILHMGHALNNTIQDVLIRYKRMLGFNVEWTPGTDHAGIATQNVVERELSKENKTRYNLGRDKFITKIWQWTERNGGTIIKQLERLGVSCDWQRGRFTLDEDYSKAVNEAFIKLYRDKLIYRGSYIINWCPRCQTALSDEEAPHRETQGNLYYIKYPLKTEDREQKTPLELTSGTSGLPLTGQAPLELTSGTSGLPLTGQAEDYVVVATTRPETLFGDTALAINPKDKRYKHLKGRTVLLPIVGRELKIIEDESVDINFGTGVVKITPFHDANDFEVANKHHLDGLLCINPDGTMNENTTEKYRGMDRFEARKVLVEDLKEKKLLEKIEPHTHSVAYCYRCQTIIEPYFSEQWFVKMKPLAKEALFVAKTNKIKFYPNRWLKIYINWLTNIRDWCISRQIWWGHRIPVWYCKKCHNEYLKHRRTKTIKLPLKVSEKEIGIAGVGKKPDRCPYCNQNEIIQDSDVLDTWFSSWLWPFAVYGWPDASHKSQVTSHKLGKRSLQPGTYSLQQSVLDYFYPTSTLVTASEIIFFWVSRMIMSGLYFMKEIPFKDVYIHGTVRDEKGRKMSKSLGNAIDPQDIIDEFGADALRFSLISLPGEDLYLSRNKFEFGRNFANKLWNASRFILMSVDQSKIKYKTLNELKALLEKEDSYLAEKWLLSKLNKMILDIEKDFNNYRLNEIAGKLYDFFWHKFCDWYIEIAKLDIKAEVTQSLLFITLKNILKLLHPFIPFITEEIWQRLLYKDEESIMISSWPQADKAFIKEEIEQEFECVLGIIAVARNKRAQFKIAQSKILNEMFINTKKQQMIRAIRLYQNSIKKLAGVENILFIESINEKPSNSTMAVVKNVEIYIPLKGLIDFDKERSRISREIEKVNSDFNKLAERLKNKKFVKQAPKEIIQKTKLRKEEYRIYIAALKKNLKELQ